MSTWSRTFPIGETPVPLFQAPPGGVTVLTVQNTGPVTVWVGDQAAQPGIGAPLYPGGSMVRTLEPGDALFAARLRDELARPAVGLGVIGGDWPAQVSVSLDQVGGSAGLVALRSNLSPKFAQQVAVFAGALAYSTPLIDFSDSLSYSVKARGDILGGNPCTLSLLWFADASQSTLLWPETYTIPPLDTAQYLNVQGPRGGAFLMAQISGTLTGAPATPEVQVYGQNNILLTARAHADGTTTPVDAGELLPVEALYPNRQPWSSYSSTAATNVEAVATQTLSVNFAATSSATSYTVPAGKRLRITHVLIDNIAPAAAWQGDTRLRTGNTTGGNEIVHWSANGASGTSNQDSITIPDGLEIPAGQQFCVTVITGATAHSMLVTLLGFLYDAP